jgi:hypothetical protein
MGLYSEKPIKKSELLKINNASNTSQVGWYMTVIPALRRLRQKDWKFEDSVDYIARPCLKKRNLIYLIH